MTSVAPFTEKQLDAHVNKIKHIYEKRKNSVEDCDPFALDLSDAESLGEESVDSATSATHAADAIDFGEKGNVMAEKIAAREKKKALKHAEDAKDSNEHTLTYILQNIKLATDAPTAFSTKKVGEDEEANIEDTGADAEAPDSPSDISVNENGPGDGFALPDDAYDADDDSVVAIESGIVILTAGLDVPFVAAYDLRNKKEKPSDKGDVYCIEVGVGTMTLATQQQRLRELVNVSDTVTCSETNPVLRNISTDIPHGFDIQPKLAGVDVKLLYGTFMNDFNYYPTTAIKNKTLGEETSLMESATSYSIMEALVEKERSDTKNNEGILRSNSSALSTIEEPAPKVSIVDVISESMVTVDPPSDVYVGPSSCALHLHTDGSLTVLLSNLQTNEKVASFDFTSTVLVNSLETASANGSMSSRSKN